MRARWQRAVICIGSDLTRHLASDQIQPDSFAAAQGSASSYPSRAISDLPQSGRSGQAIVTD